MPAVVFVDTVFFMSTKDRFRGILVDTAQMLVLHNDEKMATSIDFGSACEVTLAEDGKTF